MSVLDYHISWTFSGTLVLQFIEVDVLKATLNLAVYDGKIIVLQGWATDTELATRAPVKLIKALLGFIFAKSICYVEHIEIYSCPGGPPTFLLETSVRSSWNEVNGNQAFARRT